MILYKNQKDVQVLSVLNTEYDVLFYLEKHFEVIDNLLDDLDSIEIIDVSTPTNYFGFVLVL